MSTETREAQAQRLRADLMAAIGLYRVSGRLDAVSDAMDAYESFALWAPRDGAWLPIATAPKDGTVIDLWADGVREPDCTWGPLSWEIYYLGWPKDSVGWRAWSDRDGEWGRVENVTHWQPLQLPPEAQP